MPDNNDFRRLLGKRMAVLVKQHRLIGNLSRYPHDRSEAEAIMATLQTELDLLRAKFKLQDSTPLVRPSGAPVIDTKGPVHVVHKDPNGGAHAVDGTDRRDIRSALRTIRDGDVRGGIKHLQKVVMGWPVPDRS